MADAQGPAVPQEAPSVRPAPPAPVAPAQPQPGPDGLTPDEEATLLKLLEKQARAAAGTGAVDLRITEASGHESMGYGGITLTKDWTPVPADRVGDIATAAANAGVEIEQRES